MSMPKRFVLLTCWLLGGCGGEERAVRIAEEITGGNVTRGEQAFRKYGCGTCHEVHGVGSAQGHVGPSLHDFAKQSYLPGGLPNAPDQLVRWLRHPREAQPTTAMPELGVSERDARDLAAYLYTLE